MNGEVDFENNIRKDDKMIYLTLGYPLSVSATSSVDGYIIEITDNETQVLTCNEAISWANLLCSGQIEDAESIQKLSARGILISGENKKQLLDQCSRCHPIRQGIGATWIKENERGVRMQYFSVKLGENNYTLTDFQRLFWMYANGNQTVANILEKIHREAAEIKINNKEDQIFTLVRFGLLFVKR